MYLKLVSILSTFCGLDIPHVGIQNILDSPSARYIIYIYIYDTIRITVLQTGRFCSTESFFSERNISSWPTFFFVKAALLLLLLLGSLSEGTLAKQDNIRKYNDEEICCSCIKVDI